MTELNLLMVADGRSPIARNWIRGVLARGHRVHMVSTYSFDPPEGLSSTNIVPVAFSRAARSGGVGPGVQIGGTGAMKLRTALRHWLGPLTLPFAGRRLGRIIERIQPDLVHAMRIPYEGMLAASSGPSCPWVVSVWGNDFTLHAPASPWMRMWTTRVLREASGLHTDCRRDLRMALAWGFNDDKPATVLPGNGGIDLDVFHPGDPGNLKGSALEGLKERSRRGSPMIVNPRGFRGYVRSDTFFQAIPRVLEVHPGAVFLCPAMAGAEEAERWIGKLNLPAENIELLPVLSAEEMAVSFRLAEVMVSPSEHDGTPNSLLEAMACGCFPVCGDLESLREWIAHGENGLLIDPADPRALAEGIHQALSDGEMRRRAADANVGIVRKRAENGVVMDRAMDFYQQLAG